MTHIASRRWFYPVVYVVLIVLSMLPPITEVPYDPRNTQEVIASILMVSIAPYQSWGWMLRIATFCVVALVALRPRIAGRVLAAYIGINYMVIAALQTHAVTDTYGFAVQTGALVATALLGLLWLWVAWRDELQASFAGIPAWRWFLLPLALLVFWSPFGVQGSRVVPDFNLG